MITDEQLEELAPYIAGAQPDDRGEVEVFCPLHPDTRRSASINIKRGVWYCHAGCGGGSLRHLLLNSDNWVPLDGRVGLPPVPSLVRSEPRRTVLPSVGEIEHWNKRLITRSPKELQFLRKKRGIRVPTLRKFRIGWDGKNYRIPVYSPMGRLWNVRNYHPQPRPGRSKIWNTRGFGKPRLYPTDSLMNIRVGEDVFLCEGEWDTLLCIQHGFPAVTRTDGAGKPWHDNWTAEFLGLNVYLCFDADEVGQQSELEVADSLLEVANVYKCHLPFEVSSVGGKDITDLLVPLRSKHRRETLAELKNGATKL